MSDGASTPFVHLFPARVASEAVLGFAVFHGLFANAAGESGTRVRVDVPRDHQKECRPIFTDPTRRHG